MQAMGRYQIQQELGRGAMAAVYKALDPELNRYVALKVLHAERCANVDVRRRFLREAKAAGKLTHANIVTIFDVGEDHDHPYIAMELLDGQFLDSLLKSQEKLPADQVLLIARQLAQALTVAHTSGVIHRDIKPANIVWLPREQQAKLTDFGIARLDDATQSEATQAGHVIGTPQYMSPEQITGREIDARSDLFSLGVVLFHLLTGRRPFTGENAATLTYQIAHQDVAPVRDVMPDAPPNLARAIDRLLRKDPAQRFQTADELLQDLNAPARQPIKPGSCVVWTRVVPALVGVFLLAVAIVFFTRTSTPPPPPVESAAKAREPDAPNPALQSDVDKLIANYTCARLNAHIAPGNTVTVRGTMREDDLPTLMDALETLPQIRQTVFSVDALPWPHCEIAAMIGSSPIGSGLSLDETAPGEYDVVLPPGAGFVVADVYHADGTVVHVIHGEKSGTFSFDARAALHAERDAGDALVVAMALRQPLLTSTTSGRESAQGYLALLHRQLQASDALISASYQRVAPLP